MFYHAIIIIVKSSQPEIISSKAGRRARPLPGKTLELISHEGTQSVRVMSNGSFDFI